MRWILPAMIVLMIVTGSIYSKGAVPAFLIIGVLAIAAVFIVALSGAGRRPRRGGTSSDGGDTGSGDGWFGFLAGSDGHHGHQHGDGSSSGGHDSGGHGGDSGGDGGCGHS